MKLNTATFLLALATANAAGPGIPEANLTAPYVELKTLVLANQPGCFGIALVLSAPSPASPGCTRGTGIALSPPTTPINRLTIHHTNTYPVLKPATVLPGDSSESSTYHRPSGNKPITIDVGPVEPLDDQPATPGIWHLDSQIVVEFDHPLLDDTVPTSPEPTVLPTT